MKDTEPTIRDFLIAIRSLAIDSDKTWDLERAKRIRIAIQTLAEEALELT